MIMSYLALFINISIMFGLGSIYILLPFKRKDSSLWVKLFAGVLTGGLLLIVMNAQFIVAEGVLLDSRSILLSVGSAFLGPIPGFIAATMASVLRVYQGGAGTVVGVVVIYVTTSIGLLFGKYRLKSLDLRNIKSYFEVYLFGVVTHIVMLLCFFILPFEVAKDVLSIIWIPVLVLYPLFTIPISVILMVQDRNANMAVAIEYLSTHDYLTGLYNRLYLENSFRDYMDAENIGIIMGDANGLKTINDSYGHLVGDELLKMIASILSRVSPDEAMVVRWGGDEFVILLCNSSLLELNSICVQIKKECQKEELRGVSPSISLGYSVTEIFDLDKVFSEAEDLMYRNKLSEGASARSSIVTSLENTLYERKYETEHHSSQMAEYALNIGKELGLMQEELDQLGLIARLHDIGKIGVSESILMKPSKLTAGEFDEIKRHSQIGFRILESIDELKHISYFVLCHHEKWDGTGYPNGLYGEEIPLLSRIITIVDAYEAMTSGRIYQDKKTIDAAKQELLDCSGTQFDERLVKIFIDLL